MISSKSSRAARRSKSSAEPADRLDATRKIDEMIANLGDWRGEWLAEIRRLIHEADTEVMEDWKWRGTPVWSHEGMYANVNAFKAKVKLTFFHGAQLSDPNGLFNAGLGGNKWRAIDIRKGDKIDEGRAGGVASGGG